MRNSGISGEIFKITVEVITDLPQLCCIMRLSFVLIVEGSIKSPLHQDRAVTGVARGTRLLKEPRFLT